MDIREILKTKEKPLIIGHRGAFSEAPENTMLSFNTAYELGADMIEFDVRMCKSGEIVVIHDAEVDRTSNGEGKVGEMTLEELRKLDFGDGEKIPTLEDVLDFAKNRIFLNIELKEEDIVEKVVKLIEKYKMERQVIISSFYHGALLEVKKIKPGIITAPLFMHKPIDPGNLAIEAKSEALHPYFEYVDKEFVEKAKGSGIYLNVWTVDFPEEIERLAKLGVDGIITNDIEMAKEVLENL